MTIGGTQLLEIFRTEISFGLLGDIVKALFTEFKAEESKDILTILKCLSETNRFSLSVQFLSSKEKETVLNLYRKLECEGDLRSDNDESVKEMLEIVKKNYEIKT